LAALLTRRIAADLNSRRRAILPVERRHSGRRAGRAACCVAQSL
jgi:hypothetical protein